MSFFGVVFFFFLVVVVVVDTLTHCLVLFCQHFYHALIKYKSTQYRQLLTNIYESVLIFFRLYFFRLYIFFQLFVK